MGSETEDTREALVKGRQGQQKWEVVSLNLKFAPQQDRQMFTV